MTHHITQPRWPPQRVAWAAVWVLMAAAIVSLLDRQILSILVDPIRRDLGLDDVQISLLQGFAFALFYSTMGLPLGALVDRVNRTRLLAACIALWSLACAGCGLANSFGTLFFFRLMLGAGEAALGAATVSLVGDFFPPERRPFAMGCVAAAASAGVGLSMVGGGTLIAMANDAPTIDVWSHSFDTWRVVFVACAVPGALVALACYALPEPPRQLQGRTSAGGPLLELVQFWKFARGWLGPLVIAIAMLAVMIFATLAWAPSLIIRKYGWPASRAALTLGSLFLIVGPTAAALGGLVMRRMRSRGAIDGGLRICRAAVGTYTISLAVLAWQGAPIWVAVAALTTGYGCAGIASAVAPTVLQEATPGALRGRVSAGYFLVAALVGGAGGPLLTAVLTRFVFERADQVGASLATVAILVGPIAMLLLTLALSPYRTALQLQTTTTRYG